MNALDLLERLVEYSPGLIDGEEDDTSGADVVDRLGWLLQSLDKEEREKLEVIAWEVRKGMEDENND